MEPQLVNLNLVNTGGTNPPMNSGYYAQPKDYAIHQHYKTYMHYSPESYGILWRVFLEVVATAIFVFVTIGALTWHIYDPAQVSVFVAAIIIGFAGFVVAAIFRRYGAGYLNPLVVLACALADWRFNARGYMFAMITGMPYRKSGPMKAHHIGINFWMFILAEAVGATFASLLLWGCFTGISGTMYGFQEFNKITFSIGSIFTLDMLLFTMVVLIHILSGRKRRTVGKYFPFIIGGYDAIIHVMTAFTSHGLINIVVWLSAALLSNFGGLGVTSTAALDGWLVFGANAAAMAIAFVLSMLMPHKLGKPKKTNRQIL